MTDKAVKALQPADKPYRKFDERGLYVEVRPNGAKYWCQRYRVDGKERRAGLGVYPTVSLSQARDKSRALLESVDAGRDPRKREAGNTFRHHAEAWLKEQEAGWSPEHRKTVESRLEAFAHPTLANKPIDAITPQHIISILDFIGKRHDTAKRVLQYTSRVFQRAVIRGHCANNPCYGLSGLIPSPKVKHNPYLTEKELPDFLQALNAYNGQPVIQIALRLLLLTFVRTGELRFCPAQGEVDLERREWRIPAERMKMPTEHIVPLSTQAIALFERLESYSGKWMFPMQRDRSKPISENAINQALHQMGYKDRVTGHGFRGTASTMLHEHGFNPKAIELQLAHLERNKVAGAYNHARYMEERREIMQWWSDRLDRLGLQKTL